MTPKLPKINEGSALYNQAFVTLEIFNIKVVSKNTHNKTKINRKI